MNYIEQLNSFFDLLYTKPLSTSAICLYVILFHLNNKCGWLEEFTVANMTIQGLSGMSRNQLHKARLELIQNGYVNYKKGNGNQSGKYLLVRFDTQMNTQMNTQIDTQIDTQKQHNVGTLNKLNKTKPNNLKENVKENVKEVEKIHFAEFVTMTSDEYEKLVVAHGKEIADQCIEKLDNYKGSNGKKYKSDYKAILNWVLDEVKKKKQTPLQYTNPFQMTEEQKMADRERQKKMLQEAIDRGDFDVKHGRNV